MRVERVTGLGGIFFKARDPEGLGRWYADRLGLPSSDEGVTVLRWREHDEPEREASTVWAPFAADTTYFEPSPAPFMLNYRVRDLDAMLAQLRVAGVDVDERVEESELGRFGWASDPEGNRFELWEPPPGR